MIRFVCQLFCLLAAAGNLCCALGGLGTNLEVEERSTDCSNIASCSAPSLGVTSAAANADQIISATLSWTGGNGNGSLICLRPELPVSFEPTNGVAYTGQVSAAFNLASDQGDNNRLVYRNGGASVALSNLQPGTTYYFTIWEYNISGNCYNLTSPFTGSFSTPNAPTVAFQAPVLSVNEVDGMAYFCLTIANASNTLPVVVHVSVVGNNLPHLENYSSQTITFQAGRSAPVCAEINIADDLLCNGPGEYQLLAQLAPNQNYAAIGENGQIKLFVNDNDQDSETFLFQGFEGSTEDNWGFASTGGGGISALTGASDMPANQRIRSGSQSFQNGNATSTILFNEVNISALQNVTVELVNACTGTSTGGADATDSLIIWLSEDGTFNEDPTLILTGTNNSRWGINGQRTLQEIASGGLNYAVPPGFTPLINAPSNIILNVPDSWSSLNLKIKLNSTFNEVWSLDDVTLKSKVCNPCTTPVISDFTPNTGVIHTIIKIEGSNFLTGGNVEEIYFGSTPAVDFTVLSDSEIEVAVPEGAFDGTIQVRKRNCLAESVSTFTLIRNLCIGNPVAVPVVSEICDPQYNFETDRFIEIYNGTTTSIDLTGFTVQAAPNHLGGCAEWELSGTMAPGEALTCGFGGAVNGGPHDFVNPHWVVQPQNYCVSNFNGETRDAVRILYNGQIVERVFGSPEINNYYFANSTLIRQSTSNQPALFNAYPTLFTPNFDIFLAGADGSTPGAHTSVNPSVVSVEQPRIITNPQSDTLNSICSDARMSVAAIAQNTLSYRWFYNTGLTDQWTEILSDNAGLFSNFFTDTLIINFPELANNYQFYCEVFSQNAGCYAVSQAARLTVLPDSRRSYRSKPGVFNWSDANAWEFSADEILWEQACRTPSAAVADSIVISPNSEILLDVDATASYLTVKENAVLSTQPLTHFTFSDGNNEADLIVNGTFVDNGGTGQEPVFAPGSSWRLGPTGTLVRTNNSNPDVLHQNYHGGMSNVPATANWILRRTSNTIPTLSGTNMVYPNLQFESVSAAFTPPFSAWTMNIADAVTVRGNLTVGNPGSIQANFSTNNPSDILVEGDVTIYQNAILSNNTVTPGSGLEVKGNLNISGTLALNGGLATNDGYLVLSGEDPQTLSGTGALQVNSLVFNNSSDTLILDVASQQVNREVDFINGIAYIPDLSKNLLFWLNATHSGAGNGRYIQGKVRKAGIANFEFPIGGSLPGQPGFYQPARISNITSNTTFEAQYFPTSHPNALPYYDGTNFSISTCDYWQIERATGTGSAQITVTYGNNPCNVIGDPAYLTLARWNGFAWDNPIPEGANPGVGEVSSMTNIMSASYGAFALATTQYNANNVLPVTWLGFEARKVGVTAHLEWATASELNNDYFSVRRADDGGDFVEIGRVTGAGTTSLSSHYTFTDVAPGQGENYYQIRQVDYNGTFTETPVRAVSFGAGGMSMRVLRSTYDVVRIQVASQHNAVFSLTDGAGRQVWSEKIQPGVSEISLASGLAAGIYVAQLSDGSGKLVEKIVF